MRKLISTGLVAFTMLLASVVPGFTANAHHHSVRIHVQHVSAHHKPVQNKKKLVKIVKSKKVKAKKTIVKKAGTVAVQGPKHQKGAASFLKKVVKGSLHIWNKKKVVPVADSHAVAKELTSDLNFCISGKPDQVNALKVCLYWLGYYPKGFNLDYAHLNGVFDSMTRRALENFQNKYGIKAHGYYAFAETRRKIHDALTGYSSVVNSVQIEAPDQRGWFSRLFGAKKQMALCEDKKVRTTQYFPHEKDSDEYTDKGLTAVGSHLAFATSERAGTAAVNPELDSLGSFIILTSPQGKKQYFVGEDIGGAVVHKTASHGKAEVIDFCSRESLGMEYGHVQIIPYTGKPIQQLSAFEKEQLHNPLNWSNGRYEPPKVQMLVKEDRLQMRFAQR